MKQYLKKIFFIGICISVIFTSFSYAYDIEDVSDFLTATNDQSKAKAIEWLQITDAEAIEEGYEWAVNKSVNENTWVTEGGRYYFITDYNQLGEGSNKIHAVQYITNDTVAIGYNGKFTIYEFNSDGIATKDNTGIVYDGSGNKLENDNAKNLPVYSNYSGWKEDGGYWYYYTDATHCLTNGYAILPSSTNKTTDYNLFKFGNKGKCNSSKTSGMLNNSTIEGVKAQVKSNYTGATIMTAPTKNTSFNTNANNAAVESNKSSNTRSVNSAFQKLVQNAYEYGGGYNRTDGGWKVYSTYYRYYTNESMYLRNGFAIVANDAEGTNYSLYEFAMDGLASPRTYTGSIEELETVTTTTNYSSATEMEDNAIGTNGNSAEDLEVLTTWTWKQVNGQWRYYDGSDSYLYKGYAIVPENNAKTIWAIYYFDANGYGQKIKQGSLAQMQNDTGNYEQADWANDTTADYEEETYYESNIYELDVYEDYNGWNSESGGWKYYPDMGDEYLVSGYAIITNNDDNTEYGIFKFSSNGISSQEGQIKSSVLSLQNTYSNKSYTPARLSNPIEDYDDSDYDCRNEDDDSVYVNGKVFTDAEFQAAIRALPNMSAGNTPQTATALALIPAHSFEDAPDGREILEDEGNTQAEVAIANLPQLIDYNKWVGYTYVVDNKKALSGYAIVKWTSGTQGNQYCLAYFDGSGNVSQVSGLKVSVQKVIDDEEILDDVYQPIMWGNK